MTRHRFLCLLLVLTSTFAVSPARSDQVARDTKPCDGRADSALGEGTFSQTTVYAEIFSKAFAKACPKEAGLLNYLGTGDRPGILALQARRRAFAGSDVPLSPEDKLAVELGFSGRMSQVHQIPLFVHGWTVGYNIPCAGPALNFRSRVLALIYSRVITTWNHPLLVLDNPWLVRCAQTIKLTKRADQAGATAVFQDYLSRRNPEWAQYRRGITGQRWPTLDFACSGLGDRGMANCVRNVRGAIGYVSLPQAKAFGLKIGKVENSTGSFAAPGPEGCSAAAATAVTPPGTSPATLPDGTVTPWVPATLGDWSTVSITDAPDGLSSAPSYPICAFTYVFIIQWWYGGYGNFASQGMVRTVVDYFTAAFSDAGQSRLTRFGYAPLPPRIRQISREGIASVSWYNVTTAGF